MKFLLTHSYLHRLRWLPALAAALLAGCASPGQPRPPSLDLPEPVKDLTAERIGNEVHLHWTTPEKTTDRIAIKGSMTAAICRIAAPSTTCTPIYKFQTQSGPAQATDTLPQTPHRRTRNPPRLPRRNPERQGSLRRSVSRSLRGLRFRANATRELPRNPNPRRRHASSGSPKPPPPHPRKSNSNGSR